VNDLFAFVTRSMSSLIIISRVQFPRFVSLINSSPLCWTDWRHTVILSSLLLCIVVYLVPYFSLLQETCLPVYGTFEHVTAALLITQGGHQPGKRGKHGIVREFESNRGKVRENEFLPVVCKWCDKHKINIPVNRVQNHCICG